MDDDRFVLVRLKAGSCTNEDLRRYFAGELIAVTDISSVESDFVVTPNTKEDHQKIVEKGRAKIESEGTEFEISFESVDGCLLEKLKSLEDRSSENSGESGSFVVVVEESEEASDISSTSSKSSEGPQAAGVGNVLSPLAQELMEKAVKVSNVFSNYQDLRNFVTLEKEGGGDLEAECYSEVEGIAYFIFENPQVAANLLRKGKCKIMKRIFIFERPEIGEYLSINDNGIVYNSSEAKAKVTDRPWGDVNPSESKIDETAEREAEETACKKIRLEGETRDVETVEGKSQNDGDSADTAEMRDRSPSRHPDDKKMSKAKKKRMKRRAQKNKATMRFGDEDAGEIGKKDDITPDRCSSISGDHDNEDEDKSNDDGLNKDFQTKISYVERAEASESTYEALQMLPTAEDDFSMVESLEKNDRNEFEDSTDAFERPNSVVVYGVPDEQFFLDGLLCVLEHKRKGGGVVRDFKYDGAFGRVVVTFKDEGVAQNFVKKRTLKVHEHRVFFLSTDEELKLKRTILIPNVPKNYVESLECFVESPKKGGGKVEFEKYDEANENIWVTFASRSVADRLKQMRSLKALGRTFSILEAPFFGLIDVDFGKRTVFVGRVSEEIRRDLLALLESPKLGGRVLNHKLHRSENCLEVSFFDESVSQKLLNLKYILLMEKTYPVAHSLAELGGATCKTSDANVTLTDKPNDDDKPRHESSPSNEDVGKALETPMEVVERELEGPNEQSRNLDDARSTSQISKVSSRHPEPQDESCFTKNMTRVVVKDVPSNVDDKILQLYGESKRLGGGPCKVVYFDRQKREAVMVFDDPKDALTFVESDKDQIAKESNRKNTMTFHLLEVNPTGFESHAVLVKGFERISKDVLLFYFESKSSSRGGPVVECEFRDKSVIYVVFQNAEDARSVVDKGEHALGDKKFTVQAFPAQPPPLYIGEEMVDKNRLLVSNFKSKIGEGYLIEIMEKLGNSKVDELVKGKKLIMLVFQSQPDYFSLRKHTSCFPIKGYMLALSRVAYTKQIQLALPMNFDLSLVKAHLDALIRGKDEAKFELNKENGLVVVTFERHETVQELPLSNLKIADLKITARPYFSQLQVDSVKPVVPSEVKVFYDGEVLKFIAGRTDIQEEIEASLQNVLPLRIVWPTSESEIILKLVSSDSSVAYDWYKLAEVKLKEQLKLYHWKEKSCLKDLWKEASEHMKRCQEMPKNATVKFDDENCVVRFNGRLSECRDVEKLIDKIIDAIHSKRRKVVEEEEFEANRISLLDKMFDSLEMPKDVKVTTSVNKLTYEGPSESVSNLKLKMLRVINDFVTEEFESHPNVCKFLKRADVLKLFDDDMKKEKLLADIACSNDRIEVIGISEESLIKVRKLINSSIKEGQIKLKQDQIAIVDLEIWATFLSDLKAKLTYFELDVHNDDSIHYICLEMVEKELLDSVNKFLSENCKGEVFLKSQEGFLSAITKFFTDDLKELNDILIKQGGCIVAGNNSKGQTGFKLVGKKSELESNKRKLSLMLNKIKMETVNLRNPDIIGHFQSPATRDLIKNLETNHSVIIRTYNEDVELSQSVEKLLRFSFLKKPEILITTDEVDNINVDAIIHVFPTALDPESQKIFQLGGEEMISVAKEWFKAETKEAILISDSVGKLPCKKIYHVFVGREDEACSMSDAVQLALKDAIEHGFISASFLCPNGEDSNKESYLSTLIQTLVEFGQYSETLESFTILCEDSEALEFCKGILSDMEGKWRTKEEDVVDVDLEEKEDGELRGEFEFMEVDFDGDARRTNFSSETVSKLEVITGSIGDVRADVVVNSASKDLDLTRGQASKCLLTAAGDKLQEECTKKKPKKFEPGDIVSTKGYNLKCSKVYHVHLAIWKGEHSGKIIQTIVKNVLTKASKKNFKTVAFPALGTGNLKAPPEKVASLMFQESATFLESNPHSSIQKIYYVVYDKDLPTLKAFEEYWKNFREESPDADIVAGGRSSLVAVAASLSIDASDPHKINLGSLDVEVVKGDITSFTADAIVNSTNGKMDMSGAVGKAILKKGGTDLAEELKKTKMKATGVCVTKAGNLPTNFIVHVVAQRENSWDPIIQEALKEADSYGCSSIAFPVLGTGNFNLSAESMASVMISNFHAFGTLAGPKNLKKIYVCIYLDAIMKDFITGVKKMDPNQNQGLFSKALNKMISIKDTLKNLILTEQPSEPPATLNVDHSTITLAVYGLESDEISQVIGSIRSNIGNHFSEKLLNSERDVNLIGKLKSRQIKKINGLKEKHKVDIKVNTKDGSKGIVVSGFTDNSTSAIQALLKILEEVEKDEEDKVKAEILKEQICWEYKDANGVFQSFESLINFQLEKAHVNHKAQFSWKQGNKTYSVDFRAMKEISDDGVQKDVRRIKADPDLPKFWSKFPDSQKLSAVVLNPSHQEFITVQTNAQASAQGSLRTISKIERIENPCLYKMYQARKSAVESSLGGTKQAEMMLWHGTSSDVVDKINEKGFNRSYCGKNATAYGRGVYFAKNFNYSAHNTYSPPDANGIKHVYQCKVLVGDYTTGSQTYIAPPAKPGAQENFDSVVDNVQNPSIFVVFYDNQAYPEYLIHFS